MRLICESYALKYEDYKVPVKLVLMVFSDGISHYGNKDFSYKWYMLCNFGSFIRLKVIKCSDNIGVANLWQNKWSACLIRQQLKGFHESSLRSILNKYSRLAASCMLSYHWEIQTDCRNRHCKRSINFLVAVVEWRHLFHVNIRLMWSVTAPPVVCMQCKSGLDGVNDVVYTLSESAHWIDS